MIQSGFTRSLLRSFEFSNSWGGDSQLHPTIGVSQALSASHREILCGRGLRCTLGRGTSKAPPAPLRQSAPPCRIGSAMWITWLPGFCLALVPDRRYDWLKVRNQSSFGRRESWRYVTGVQPDLAVISLAKARETRSLVESAVPSQAHESHKGS